MIIRNLEFSAPAGTDWTTLRRRKGSSDDQEKSSGWYPGTHEKLPAHLTDLIGGDPEGVRPGQEAIPVQYRRHTGRIKELWNRDECHMPRLQR